MGAVKRTFRTLDDVHALIAVTRGEAPPQMLITGGEVLNAYSGELLAATVAVTAGRIAYVGERRIEPGPSTTIIDARGRVVAPGYFDPHGHPQALFTPVEFARAVLPLGTTAIMADTLLLLNLTPPERTAEILTTLAALPLHFFWFLRLHGQAHSPGDATVLGDERLAALMSLEEVRTVGEVTRWPQVYAGDATLLTRMARGLAAGRRVEGHAPGVSADRLQVLAAAGFSSDHEAITAEQALDRLRAGLYVMLRHGSLRPDLPALAAIATGSRAYSGRLMLTLDGPSPTFIQSNGYMDHVLDVAMRVGVDPVAVHQMATINPATYYSLDEEIGGLAPGRRADILLLDRIDRPRPQAVIAGGQVVARDGRLIIDLPEPPWAEWLRPFTPGPWRPVPSFFALDGLPSPTPAMHLESAVIAARRDVEWSSELPPGVLRLFLVDPAGRWRCRTLLSGFADDLGGLASTYTSGAGMYTLGRNTTDMAVAASRALDLGGGIVLVEDGAVQFEIPLPLGGMMSPRPMVEMAAAVETLTGFMRAQGHTYHDLPCTLLFLGFDALPYVRLTYRGLWDVLGANVLIPREDL
ncbi:MAG: adenine deaminase C-terminal domain-containing protein [Armatimonadota bacterium]